MLRRFGIPIADEPSDFAIQAVSNDGQKLSYTVRPSASVAVEPVTLLVPIGRSSLPSPARRNPGIDILAHISARTSDVAERIVEIVFSLRA